MSHAHHRKHRIKLRSLYVWHRYTGLGAALFATVLSVTGILLNHTERFAFDERFVQSNLILDWYGIDTPEHSTSFELGQDRITLFGQHLYLGNRELPGEYEQLIGGITRSGMHIIAVDNDILLLTLTGELVERLGGKDGVPSGMRRIGGAGDGESLVVEGGHANYQPDADFLEWSHWDGNTDTIRWKEPAPLPEPLYTSLVKHYRGEVLPVERVLLDLHSGRIFGKYGIWVMDAAAVVLILLAVTGTWMWLKRRR